MNKTNVPMVACSHCGGAGRVRLSDELALTLEAVRNGGPTGRSCGDIQIAVNTKSHGGAPFIKLTAVINRLATLHDLGLVTRTRANRRQGWTYKVSAVDEVFKRLLQ